MITNQDGCREDEWERFWDMLCHQRWGPVLPEVTVDFHPCG